VTLFDLNGMMLSSKLSISVIWPWGLMAAARLEALPGVVVMAAM
jgi:hypothetical protein